MYYPQFDIRHYDPHVSPALAHLVMGSFYFTDLPHDARVMRLFGLIQLYKAVIDIGELEHTSDWDWRITVMYAPDNEMASYAGTHDDDNDYRMSDTIVLPYEAEPNDYLDRFARWQVLQVEELDNNGGATMIDVPIDQIRVIQIGYDT